MTSKRIGVYLPDVGGGGAERSMINVAAGLAERGHIVDLVVANAAGAYLSQLPSSVRLVDLKAGIPRKSVRGLVRYLREARPAALMSALDNANLAAIVANRLAGRPTRVAISIRNQLSIEYRDADRRLKRQLAMVRLLYPYADRIVAVSKGVADDLSSLIGLSRDRIEVIYNPIVSDDLLLKAQEPIVHPWFAPGEPPVILSVGRLSFQKDQAMLLRAFAKVRSKIPAWLMILGDGEERSALERLAQDLQIQSYVSLPGFAQNPFAYMNKAAVFALSSKFEGLPGVLIQAMASGAPVVSTNCPSGPSEILMDGKYGPLVPVGDSDAMADAILAVLAGPGTPAPPEALDRFRTEYAIDQIIKVLLD